MIRRLFTILSAGSLVLCLYFTFGACAHLFIPDPTGLQVYVQPLGPERQWTTKVLQETNAYRSPPPDLDVAGFRIQRLMYGQYTVREGREFVVPWWFLALVTAIPPALWTRAFRRNRRIQLRLRSGLCLHCAYDLRAHHPGQLCPECGTPVPADLKKAPTP